MKIYSDDKNANIVQPIASASTLLSSVAGEIRDFVVSKFPKNFFKSIYIDTAETVSEQRKNDKFNKNLNKIPYPSMGITPEISLDDPIGGMEKSFQLSSPNLFLRKDLNRTYKKILIDPDRRLSMYYTSDYITTNFNFRIVTNSFIQNADLAYYIKSNFQSGVFQYLNQRYLQTEIPKTFIKIIAGVLDLNLDNKEDMDALRLYLIGTNKLPQNILKKINLSTGKTCFFVDDEVNFLTLLTDIDAPPSVVRNQQVEGEYTLSFRVQVSTWLPNAFILSIDEKLLNGISNTDDEVQDEGFFTINLKKGWLTKKDATSFLDINGEEHIGQLVHSEIFTQELNSKLKEISILDKLPEDFLDVYEYLISPDSDLGIDPSSLVHIQVVSSNGTLDPSLYTIEYKEIKGAAEVDCLKISLVDDLDSDIGIGVYVNRTLFESLKIAKEKKKNFFGSDYMSVVKIFTSSEDFEKIIVRRASADTTERLCINTPYGIGEIGFEDPSDEKTELRMFLGDRVVALEKSLIIEVAFTSDEKLLQRKNVQIGDKYGKMPSNPKKEGYSFVGWFLEDGTKVTGNSIVKITENHVISAKFEKK